MHTGNKFRDGHGTAPQWTELGNFCTVTRDDERFATGNAVQHVATVVTKLPHADSVHYASVSPVRQARAVGT